MLHAIRVVKDITMWNAAVQEAVYQDNSIPHQSTGFSPKLLHHGYEHASPGLLHPEGVPANPLPNMQVDKMKFTKMMQEMCKLFRGIVLKNQESAHKRADKHYLMRAINLPINSWGCGSITPEPRHQRERHWVCSSTWRTHDLGLPWCIWSTCKRENVATHTTSNQPRWKAKNSSASKYE